MTIEFDGFHGTNSESAQSIVKKNYKKSFGDEEWLGDGVYFFIDGISKTPYDQAESWAVLSSWDKVINNYKYKNYSILKSKISVNNDFFLDLTTSDGDEIIEFLVNEIQRKIKKINKSLVYIDGFIINFARKENLLNIDVAKGNFYIKLTKESRVKDIRLRTCNSTICAVYDPVKCINKTEIVNENIISYETDKRNNK